MCLGAAHTHKSVGKPCGQEAAEPRRPHCESAFRRWVLQRQHRKEQIHEDRGRRARRPELWHLPDLRVRTGIHQRSPVLPARPDCGPPTVRWHRPGAPFRSRPRRTLYNALVPFAVAAVEHFLSRSFKVLLQFDAEAPERFLQQTRKVEMVEAVSIAKRELSIEDVVVGWYSFQNIDSIQRAFREWLKIDFRATLRRRRRIGRRVVTLDAEFRRMIEARHGFIHRFDIDRGLQKQDVSDLLDAAMAVIDAFVDHLESQRSMSVRDRA